MDIPGSGIVAERKPGEPFLVLREKTSEEKAKSGSSVMEGIGVCVWRFFFSRTISIAPT